VEISELMTHNKVPNVEILKELPCGGCMKRRENVCSISSKVGIDDRSSRVLLGKVAHIIHLPGGKKNLLKLRGSCFQKAIKPN
jgi:hypothetical protein